jgi:hypothetical protein
VQRYSFSIHNGDDSYREQTGFMALADDVAAHDFGKLVISDLMHGPGELYAGWTMDVASGQRAVCSIPFSCS